MGFVRDITERFQLSEQQKRLQNELENKVEKRTEDLEKERLAALELAHENRLSGFGLEHAAIAFFLINQDGQILRVNAAACEETGFSREELLEKTVFDLDPEFPKESWAKHWEELKKLKFRRFEASHLHKDGKKVPKEIDGNYVEFEGQGYHFAFVRDISERRQWARSQEHLQAELEKRVQELLNQRRSALQLADEADEARSRAEAAEKELTEVADQLALPHGETTASPEPIHIDELTLSDEMAVGRQIRALCKQYDTLEGYATGLLQFLFDHFQDEKDDPAFGLLQLHLTSSFSNLKPGQQETVRKMLPDAKNGLPCLSLEASCLRPEWEFLANSFEAAIPLTSETFADQYFPLATLLSQLNHNLLNVDSRDSHFHHEGVAAIHVQQTNHVHSPPHDSSENMEPKLKSLVGFGDYLLEDTHFLLTAYTCTPLSSESARFFVHLSHSVRIGILHFIKHHRRTFTQIQAVDSLLRGHEVFSTEQEGRLLSTMSALTQSNDELRRSNDELDKFAFAASHDLKSPLFAIQSLVNMIKEDMGEDLPHEVERNFDRLQRRVYHMEDLLDALLNYSRIGYVEDAPSEVRLRDFFKAVMGLLDIPRGVTIELPEEMPTLIAPKGALLRVFTNLMSNSIKHGGRADLNIEIACEDLGEFYSFTISDNGIGIHQQHHDKVFEMFKSLEAKHLGGTSGMGLALVKKTIEHHGGIINLKSSPDEGARFTFTWPKSTLSQEHSI